LLKDKKQLNIIRRANEIIKQYFLNRTTLNKTNIQFLGSKSKRLMRIYLLYFPWLGPHGGAKFFFCIWAQNV